MKKYSIKTSLDTKLEVAGFIAALIIIAGAVIALLNYKNAQGIFIGIFGIGTVLNGILTVVNWHKNQKFFTFLFSLFTIYLGILCVFAIINY